MANFKELKLLDKIKILCSTLFFIGYFPLIPGTMGTLAVIPFYLLLSALAPNVIYVLVLVILVVMGLWSAHFAEDYFEKKDPKPVVIDEAAGYLMAMLFIHPTLLNILLGFIIFRLMDIIKPPPARSLEQWKGGAGIMADDLVAGFYTNLLLQVLLLMFKLIST